MKRVLQALFPLLIFFVVVEAASQWAIRSRTFLSRIEGNGSVGRQLGALQRARTATAGGRDVLHLAAEGRLTSDTLTGWTNNPGVHQTPDGVATIDEAGRRITAPPGTPPGSPRVALFGDSFTFGDEVADDETWAWLLREHTGAEVLDLGVMGFGLDQIVLRTESDWPDPAPDIAMLCLTPVVTLRVGLSWDAWVKPWFTLDGDELVLHGPPFPSPAETLDDQPLLATTWMVRLWRERLQPSTDWFDTAAVSEALINRWVDEVRGAGATPVIAYLPFDADFTNGRPTSQPHTQFRGWCRARPEVACIDLFPVFRAAHQRGVPLTRRSHWTPEGNALAAREIALGLEQAGLLEAAPARGSEQP